MDLSKVWVKDPKHDNKPSVTLTLVVITFVLTIIAAGLNMAGVVPNTSVLLEMFYGALGTYLGRRLSFNGKSYGTEKDGPVE